MRVTICDLESDNLLDKITKIYIFSYQVIEDGIRKEKGSLYNYKDIIDFLNKTPIVCCHNFTRFDKSAIKKILNYDYKGIIIDSLAISWYLYPLEKKHGLGQWGEKLGFGKPKIDDFTTANIEELTIRCEGDVEINTRLFFHQWEYLNLIYDNNEKKLMSFINYLTFKMDCIAEQEEIGCKIDIPLVNKSLEELYILQNEKINALSIAMPKDIKYKIKTKPNKIYRKDGSLSSSGESWFNLLEEYNLSQDYEDELTIKVSEIDGNPKSSTQIKSWLYSLGWEPDIFKSVVNKNTKVSKDVPQISDENGDLYPSVKILIEVEPSIQNLEMLAKVGHRIGILKSFLENSNEQGFTKATIKGLTNSLRSRHSVPIVNLPSIKTFYGKQIRGSIIAPDDNHLLYGSDLSSLEANLADHYMYFFDPEYVKKKRTPGWDPHINLIRIINWINDDDVKFFKEVNKNKKEVPNYELTLEESKRYTKITDLRAKGKTATYAFTYSAGAKKVSISTGMSLEDATMLFNGFWEINDAIKKTARACTTKITYYNDIKQIWLFNPISKFWYSLRYEKDLFSLINQSSASYVFDLWVKQVRSKGIKVCLSMHDEIAGPLLKGTEDYIRTSLRKAIEEVNQMVKLNVQLDISVDINNNYGAIH